MFRKGVEMKKLLIIEDEPAIVMLLRELMQDEGYNVQTALDGHQGLTLFQQSAPDLIMLDLSMPGLGGKDVVNFIRSAPVHSEVPIIIITGSDVSFGEIPPEGTYQALLMKPFDLEELVQLVAGFLQ